MPVICCSMTCVTARSVVSALAPGYVAASEALIDPSRWPHAVAEFEAYEEATGRGNPLITKTKTAQFIHGKKLSEFPPEKSDELGALNDHFNKLLEAVGAAK